MLVRLVASDGWRMLLPAGQVDACWNMAVAWTDRTPAQLAHCQILQGLNSDHPPRCPLTTQTEERLHANLNTSLYSITNR